jgi:hypothetical protein
MLSVLMVTLWPYVWYILIHCIPWNLARIAVNCEACQATDDEPKQWSTQGNSIGWNHDVSEAEIKGSQRISKGDDMWWLMTKTMKQLNLWIVKVCEGILQVCIVLNFGFVLGFVPQVLDIQWMVIVMPIRRRPASSPPQPAFVKASHCMSWQSFKFIHLETILEEPWFLMTSFSWE